MFANAISSFSLKNAADAAGGGHKPQQPAAVIGIDFGTSGSGYMAVVLPAPGRAKQTTMCTAWPDCPEASGDSKTRTALLYRGSKVDSFGWTAWKRWAGMTEAERRKEDWCYVEGFKLLLDGEDSGSVSSSGDGGSSLAPPDELVATGVSSQLPRGKGATEVVSDFLAELRKYVTKRLQGPRPAAGATATATAAPAPPALDMKSVVWCVTVPALWHEAAKQRLRRAASMAVGAGGGKAPPAVHLYEAAVGCGIKAGGRFVDAALFALLRGHVGPEVWDEWKKLHPGEWTDFAMRWETTKRVIKGGHVDLQLPPGLVAMRRQQPPAPQPPDGVILDSITGVVQLSERVLEAEVFGPVMEQIVVAAAEVEARGREQDKRLTKVLLAGGFGNSRLLQRRLLRLAGEWGVPLVLPRDPGAAVVTGAALLGLEPSFVVARRSRLTYGVRCRAPWTVAFAESAAAFGYPQRVWRDEDGTIDADDVFETFVHAGQLVGTNEVVKRVFCPNSSTSTATQCDLYCTPAALATCVAEPGMRRLATVTLPLPEGWLKAVGRRTDYAVQVEMHFGTSEIKMAQPAAVIGIDFGTSGSGYAAILGPFASGAAQRPIKSCAQWPDDPHSGGELKTKTAILYRGDKVDAWGWTAWRRWSEMSAAERLTADCARGGPDLKALGPRLPKGKNAVDVVSDFLSELRRRPRSACAELPTVLEGEEQELEDGDVVLVVDCGGGTADVTLHEVVIDEAQGDIPMTIHLYEAAVGKGAEAGGRSVDAALFALLRGHVGPEVWDEWKKLHPGEWTELSSKWEDKKTKMKEGDPALELQLPPALMARCQQRMAVQSPAAQPGLHLDATLGLVQFSRELLRAEVFGPVMDQIAAVVKEVEAEGRQRRGKKATKMLLAGGFGNSPLLQERMRELQRQLGAALLGAEPGLVRARRCRLTYGIRCRALWTSEEAVSYSAFGYPQRIWKPEDNEYFAGAWRVGA
eukprot:XP_001696572.1 predicted protein [Chlamydomonas reinhardtii]